MAGYRSKILCSKVQKKVDKYEDYVYSELNAVQLEICERASALEYKYTISIIAGQELYNFPDGFIVNRVVQPNSSNGISEINIEMLTDIKSGDNSRTTEISYFYKFNKQIGFMLNDGSAPLSAATIYVYGWRRPKEDRTEDIGRTIDPILDKRWDYCMILGAASRLVDDPKLQVFYQGLYEQEFEKQNLMEDVQKDIVWTIPANSEYD
jgi:hypothetical protein